MYINVVHAQGVYDVRAPNRWHCSGILKCVLGREHGVRKESCVCVCVGVGVGGWVWVWGHVGN